MDGRDLDITVSSIKGIRPENQDSAGFHRDGGFLFAIVCDGIGGMPDGAGASSFVSGSLLEWARTVPKASAVDMCRAFVEECVSVENSLIETHPGSGTTLVAVIGNDGEWFTLHLGDSRCYAVHGDDVTRTSDHSPIEAMLKAGLLDRDEVADHPFRNMVSKFMGGGFASEIEINRIGDWDLLALCSDGAFGYMDEEDFARCIVDNDAAAVTGEALEKGSRDNISVVRIKRIHP